MFGFFTKKKENTISMSPLHSGDPRYMLLPPSSNQLTDKNQKWFDNQGIVLHKFETGLAKGSIEELEDALSCFQAYNLFITENHLEFSKQKGQRIYDFLQYKQKETLGQLTYLLNPHDVVDVLLNYHTIPAKALLNLITTKSNFLSVFNEEENPQDGNTLLHRLILENESAKLSLCVQAILKAKFVHPGNLFNSKKTNHAKKTIWHLALESENAEIIQAVLLYVQPKCTSLEREKATFIMNLDKEKFDALLQQQEQLKIQAMDWALAQTIAEEELELPLEYLDFTFDTYEKPKVPLPQTIEVPETLFTIAL